MYRTSVASASSAAQTRYSVPASASAAVGALAVWLRTRAPRAAASASPRVRSVRRWTARALLLAAMAAAALAAVVWTLPEPAAPAQEWAVDAEDADVGADRVQSPALGAGGASTLYAVATFVAGRAEEAAAVQLCWSVRHSSAGGEAVPVPADVSLVALCVPGADTAAVRACFDEVVRVGAVPPGRAEFRLWDALWTYGRVVFVAARSTVVDARAVFALVRRDVRFAAAQAVRSGAFAQEWSTGVMVLQPGATAFDEIVTSFDGASDETAAALLTRLFPPTDPGVAVLDGRFAVDVCLEVETVGLWRRRAADPAVVQFTLLPPWWTVGCASTKWPYTEWRANDAEARAALGHPDPPRLSGADLLHALAVDARRYAWRGYGLQPLVADRRVP